jgi:hypothetical protein
MTTSDYAAKAEHHNALGREQRSNFVEQYRRRGSLHEGRET